MLLSVRVFNELMGAFCGLLLSFCAAVFCYSAVNKIRARDCILYVTDELCERRGKARVIRLLPYLLLFLSGGVFPVLCAIKFENFTATALSAAFLTALCAVSLCDIKTMEIPDSLSLFILALGICAIFVFPEVSLPARLIGFAAVSFPLLLLALLVPGGFGGGDIKLMAACGFFLGWKLILLSALLGIVAGGVYGVYLLLIRHKSGKTQFAFGPFLCFATALCVFFGDKLCDVYQNLFFV